MDNPKSDKLEACKQLIETATKRISYLDDQLTLLEDTFALNQHEILSLNTQLRELHPPIDLMEFIPPRNPYKTPRANSKVPDIYEVDISKLNSIADCQSYMTMGFEAVRVLNEAIA